MIVSARSRRFLGVALAAALLGACNVLPEPRVHEVYRLPPSSIGASAQPPVEWGLRIARPAHDDLLGSANIAVLPNGNRMSVYERARWTSAVPALWRDHLLDAFQNDGRIRRLSSDSDMLQADIELGGRLRAFQSEYRNGHPEVVLRLDAHLVQISSRRILARERFEITQPVQGVEVPRVVEAFGLAADRLAAQVISWTLQEAANNGARAHSEPAPDPAL